MSTTPAEPPDAQPMANEWRWIDRRHSVPNGQALAAMCLFLSLLVPWKPVAGALILTNFYLAFRRYPDPEYNASSPLPPS